MYGYFGEAYFAGETIAQVVTASITVAEIMWMADWDTAVSGSAGPETIGIVESVPGGSQTITVADSIVLDDSGVSVSTPGAMLVSETITSTISVSLSGSVVLTAAAASPQDSRVPLCVQLRSARQTRDITDTVRDLTFRSVAPGGFASATFDLSRPLLAQGDDLAEYAKVRITDARNASVIWEGHLEDPGRSTGSDGDVWRVTAIGPSGHAQDVSAPYIGIDSHLDSWVRAPSTFMREYVDDSVDDNEDLGPALRLAVGQGQAVAVGFVGAMVYPLFAQSGQQPATIAFSYICGITDASNYKLRVWFLADPAGVSLTPTAANAFFSTLPTPITLFEGLNWFGSSWTTPMIAMERTSAGAATDQTWVAIGASLTVRPKFLDKAGGARPYFDYTPGFVTAPEIVEDLLGGGRLPLFDGANAVVDTTLSPRTIDHLAYPDPVTTEAILADLMNQESGFYWAAWESNSAGKYRFEWVAWPTTVRYDVDLNDSFDSPGSTADVYDKVRVRWRDQRGQLQSTLRTSSVPALTAAGISRTGSLDLGDNVASGIDNAIQAGDNFLADHASPSNAGTITITVPVMDRVAGRMVSPHELRPGTLLRVRGIRPSVDSLNASARDGVSVFRVVSVEYRASEASAVLELDSYSRTTAEGISRATKDPITRRR